MPAGNVYDEQTRVLWFADADTPADLEAITAAELADGVDLSGYMPPDGLAFGAREDRVPGADILSAYDGEAIGRYGDQPALTLKRKLRDGGEEAWTTFAVRRSQGTLVVFSTLDVGVDPGVGDTYRAYPCENGSRMMQNSAANTEVKFVVNFAVTDPPVDGTVVAS